MLACFAVARQTSGNTQMQTRLHSTGRCPPHCIGCHALAARQLRVVTGEQPARNRRIARPDQRITSARERERRPLQGSSESRDGPRPHHVG
jgi:hypothetical protein